MTPDDKDRKWMETADKAYHALDRTYSKLNPENLRAGELMQIETLVALHATMRALHSQGEKQDESIGEILERLENLEAQVHSLKAATTQEVY